MWCYLNFKIFLGMKVKIQRKLIRTRVRMRPENYIPETSLLPIFFIQNLYLIKTKFQAFSQLVGFMMVNYQHEVYRP